MVKIDCQAVLEDKVYLGSLKAAKNHAGLKSLGITHILSLGGSPPYYEGIEYLALHFPDSSDEKSLSILKTEVLPTAIDWVNTALTASDNHKVLIHCQAGINRSPAVAVAILMNRLDLTVDEAYQAVKSARKAVRPQDHYKQVLEQFKSNT
jgi:atypical dual specificity phosphatase